MRPTIRVGTRPSVLAVTQTRQFTSRLTARHPELRIEEVHITSAGDLSTEPLGRATTPGLFVSELRASLLAGETDLIIHSMKDLPARPHPGIVTACVPTREDPRDVLVSRDGRSLAELPAGSVIGTSSPRRTASIRRTRPDLVVIPIRGNVDTRLAKVQRGDYDATMLALAGLARIGRSHAASEIFDTTVVVPAAGQGALSVECREHDDTALLLADLEDPLTRLVTTAERSVLVGLDAGCATAIGVTASLTGGRLTLLAELSREETGECERVELSEPLSADEIQSPGSGALDRAESLGLRAAAALDATELRKRLV